jgi:hypothetical protein
MAMRKSDIEQENAKRSKDEDADDFLDDEAVADDTVEDIEVSLSPNKDLAARKRLEEYLEEKRLRKELDDDLFD